jgi:hypothetical protein
MSDLAPAIRAAVVLRACNRCEYCRLSQVGREAASPVVMLKKPLSVPRRVRPHHFRQ